MSDEIASALEYLRAWYEDAKDTHEGKLALKWRRAMAPDVVAELKASYTVFATDEEQELAIVRRLVGELADAMGAGAGRRSLLEAEINALASQGARASAAAHAQLLAMHADLEAARASLKDLETMLDAERAAHAKTRADLEAARAALVPVSHVDVSPLPLAPVAEEPVPEAPPAEAGPVTRKDSRKPQR